MTTTNDTKTVANASADWLEEEVSTVQDFIIDRPIAAVAIAVVFGFLVAKFVI